MDNNSRSPEHFLRELKESEARQGRGRLKIFFGYAAGVGKTYAMLEAAHQAQRAGTDVLAGYIEPHTRPETMKLLEGLELLPPLELPHGDIILREFDLDGALKRRPRLILVDELAHTNAPSCRHRKRYQDVEELLRAGIDVYTTVNVQHIESLNDSVASITGISVRERIPDFVFDRAEQVELVDIEPSELLERLKSGRVYRENQARRAMANFFTLPNLTALRETALRRCADRVGSIGEKAGGRPSEEHILVCLSSSPSNARIIRTAARMAQAFRGSFTALFVETPAFSSMSEENLQRLRSNVHLAEQLGAVIETVYGSDVPFQIAEFARLSGVSRIVIGRSAARARLFGKQSLTEKLISAAPDTDIHIIPDSGVKPLYRRGRGEAERLSLPELFKSLAVLTLATLISFVFYYLGFEEANIIIVYVLGVLLTSVITCSRICSIGSSVISVLVFNFFFTEPRMSLRAYDPGYPVTFLIMFLAALISSSLAVKLSEHARQAAQAAYRSRVLFDVNQSFQLSGSREEILSTAATHLTALLGRDVVIYPASEGRLSQGRVYPAAGEPEEQLLSQREAAVALWVFKNNKRAGAGTQTLSNASCLYHAIRINQSVYGVLGIAAARRPLDSSEQSMLLSVLGECALSLENEKNAREKEEAAVLAQKEQLRANLLRSISHDLRTPLTSISGNASNFLSNGDSMDSETRRRLFTDIYDDSMWLINLVENLLSVTRLEENRLNLHLSSELVADAVEEALRHINRRSSEYKIKVQHEDELLMARMDGRLVVQLIINLVDNAIKYTPPGSEITVKSRRDGDMARISVIDNGPGIADSEKARIFDMFYSGSNKIADSRRSLGLGLSLCKSIVCAHGGEIAVSDNKPRGTVFSFTLPGEELQLHR